MIRRPPISTLFPSPPLFRSPLVPGVACGHALAGAPLELDKRPAGQYVDVPRLDVRSGRRPSRGGQHALDRKSTRLNSSHTVISYAVFCLKKKKMSTCLLTRS